MTKKKSEEAQLHERLDAMSISDLERFMNRLILYTDRYERIQKVAEYTGLSEEFLMGDADNPA